jgi:hypothetical protein
MTNTSGSEIQKKDKIQTKAMQQISEYTKCLKLKLQSYFYLTTRNSFSQNW